MKTIGRHLIAEYYDCQQDLLNSVAFIRDMMLRSATEMGATVVGETFHAFSPHGVSGTVVIAESHLSIHTWPENGYVAVDIYTCGGLNPNIAFAQIGRELGAATGRQQEILRGLPDEISDEATLAPSDVKIMSRIAPIKFASASPRQELAHE